MTTSASPSVAVPGRAAGAPNRRRLVLTRLRALPRPRPELVGLLVIAAALDGWALDRNGWANEYYSAAVRSMASSWHAFLYGSFDPSGVMTVDKPPLALWVQALSVRVFGFHGLSVLVPQALMGVATVALVYDLVRRRWGRVAGFVGGLVLALTPIAVAVSRHNNPDALLVLCSAAAVWCVVRALEDGRTRWLVVAGACVGLGFEAKMGAALLVAPALAAAWLWVAPRGRLAAVRQLGAGGAALVAVGGAWPLLVALTPAADRPWVAGTSDNSIWSLILGYNGLGRLDGQAGGPGGGMGGAAGGGAGPFGGDAGPLRLLDASLGGQAGWLLGVALVGGVAILLASRLRRTDPRTGWLVAVGGAGLTTAVAFSFAEGIFHPYYVSLLAPFAAALVGATAGALHRGEVDVPVVGGLAVAAGVACELVVLRATDAGLAWLGPVLVVAAIAVIVVLAATEDRRWRGAALAAALGLLLLAPVSWAVQTLGHATNGTFPAGGPASASAGGLGGPRAGRSALRPPGTPATAPGVGGPARGGFGGGGPFGGDTASLARVVRYARTHGGGTIAVSSQMGAAPQVVSTGADVAALGGFSGRETEVSIAWLADTVRAGRVRWVLSDGSGGAGGPNDARVGARRVMAAVAQTCRSVPASEYSDATSSGGTLYDCRGRAGALAKLAGT
jgi:4-amino-4-deoxy-L-arabinose transferase-like glycosyltransferase